MVAAITRNLNINEPQVNRVLGVEWGHDSSRGLVSGFAEPRRIIAKLDRKLAITSCEAPLVGQDGCEIATDRGRLESEIFSPAGDRTIQITLKGLRKLLFARTRFPRARVTRQQFAIVHLGQYNLKLGLAL